MRAHRPRRRPRAADGEPRASRAARARAHAGPSAPGGVGPLVGRRAAPRARRADQGCGRPWHAGGPHPGQPGMGTGNAQLAVRPGDPAAGGTCDERGGAPPQHRRLHLRRDPPAGPDPPEGRAGVSSADVPERLSSAQRAPRAPRAVPRGAVCRLRIADVRLAAPVTDPSDTVRPACAWLPRAAQPPRNPAAITPPSCAWAGPVDVDRIIQPDFRRVDASLRGTEELERVAPHTPTTARDVNRIGTV